MVGYVALVLVGVAHHEPWFDEAQAWLLARDASVPQLVTRYAAYEGSPVLWHLVLLLPAKAHLPYIVLNLISVTVAGIGVFLFVKYAPFHPALRVGFAFSYYAAYQYSVVARSYALLLPLTFLLAMAYPSRHVRPGRYVLLLGALSMVTTHGMVIAVGLALVLALEVLRGGEGEALGRRRFRLAWLLGLAAFLVLLGYTLRTPADQSFVGQRFNLDVTHARQVLVHVSKWAFTGQAVISIVVLGASLAWFAACRRLLLFTVPFAGLMALFMLKYFSPWHEGIVLLLWMFVFWVTFAQTGAAPPHRRMRRIAVEVLAVTLAFQVVWTLQALRYDFDHPYSGSRAAAQYIKERGIYRHVIYGSGFWAMALQPYFDHNIYANYHDGRPPSFWLWEKRNRFGMPPARLADARPDYILYGIKFRWDRKVPRYSGYREVRTFTGGMFYQVAVIEAETYVLFQREDLPPLS
jgi:hypothetical protein